MRVLVGAFLLAVRQRPTATGGSLQFVVGELERHGRIVAPPGAPVHAVVGAARDWMAAPRAGGLSSARLIAVR